MVQISGDETSWGFRVLMPTSRSRRPLDREGKRAEGTHGLRERTGGERGSRHHRHRSIVGGCRRAASPGDHEAAVGREHRNLSRPPTRFDVRHDALEKIRGSTSADGEPSAGSDESLVRMRRELIKPLPCEYTPVKLLLLHLM